MENAGQSRTIGWPLQKACPTCGRRFNKRKTSAWKPGVGAVRKRDRVGFTAADVRMALYQCKYAQWKQQEGACGFCNEPMDPKHAVWINSKWLDGTGLSKWALGRELVFNQCTDEFDAHPRSPEEILDEYGHGLRGHYLWHKRCRARFRQVGAGIPIRGPAHVREYDRLVAGGFPHDIAVTTADNALRDQSRARMEEARSHKASKRRTWQDRERSEPRTPARRKRRKQPASVTEPSASTVSCQPDSANENLRAEQETAASRPMTDLERAAYSGGSVEDRLARLAEALGG